MARENNVTWFLNDFEKRRVAIVRVAPRSVKPVSELNIAVLARTQKKSS